MGLVFLGEDYSAGLDDASFVISPFPYDATASYGTGARFAPVRILEASTQLELFDEELEACPYKAGIHTLEIPEVPIEPDKARRLLRGITRNILLGKKIPIFLGGDHSISIGIIEAVTDIFKDITVLHLDAHTDMRNQYQGTPLSHACIARRASELCRVVQAGIRSSSETEWKHLKKMGNLPVTAYRIKKDIGAGTREILERITSKKVYVTVDVDCLDPSIMPATGTPEPGGLDWFELLYILKQVTKQHKVVGFDVVELSPVPGLHFPEFTCARLIYKMIGYMEAFKEQDKTVKNRRF